MQVRRDMRRLLRRRRNPFRAWRSDLGLELGPILGYQLVGQCDRLCSVRGRKACSESIGRQIAILQARPKVPHVIRDTNAKVINRALQAEPIWE